MGIKNLCVAAISGLLLSVSAAAATIITGVPSATIGTGGAAYNNIVLPYDGPFSDTLNFSLAAGLNRFYAAFQTGFWGSVIADAGTLSFDLTQGTSSAVIAHYSPLGVISGSSNDFYSNSVMFSGLSSGVNYHLAITGTEAFNLGSQIGTALNPGTGQTEYVYAYTLLVAGDSALIPEPGSKALLSLGLLLAYATRRLTKMGG